MSSAKTRTGKWIILSLIVLGLTGAVYAGIVTGTWQWLTGLIQEKTHPALLLVTFLVLPVVGFPISVFLILLGIRFGPGYGLLIMWTGMGTHLLITFILSRSYIRPWLFLLADKWAFTVPRLPENRQILVSLLFMAVPGLPYTLKNYLLALAGVPFVTYFTVSWIANGLMGTPFVVLQRRLSQVGDRSSGGFFIRDYLNVLYRKTRVKKITGPV